MLTTRVLYGYGCSKRWSNNLFRWISVPRSNRVYKIKTYGEGKAFDNTCSLLLDISGLEEAVVYTKVKGTVESTVKGTVTTKAGQ